MRDRKKGCLAITKTMKVIRKQPDPQEAAL